MMFFIITFANLIVMLAGDMCVNYYSFDDHYTRKFDSRSCGGNRPWGLVKYTSVGVTQPKDSDTGLITSSASCISSFPKKYTAGGVLKFLVYSAVECTTQVSVHNHEDDLVIASKTYRPGVNGKPDIRWREIIIGLDETFSGYIRLRGSCMHENNFILVDSIKYSINKSSLNCHESKSRNVVLEDEDAAEFIIYNEKDDVTDMFREDGSGEEEPEDEVEEGSGTSWNAFTIALTVIGVSFGLALGAYGAYYCGKNSAINDVDRFLVDDLETEAQSTITLPRVRPVFRID